MLRAEGPIDQRVLDVARYFVTLRLERRETNLVAEHPAPRRVVMQEMAVEASPLLSRLAPAARERLFRGREPRLRKPLALSDHEPVEGLVVNDAPREQTVAERMRVDGQPLVAMRILRPKNADV